MKNIFILFVTTLFIVSCSSEKQGNMTVTGKIKDLKKGKLYLQKMKDTLLISVDSVALNGTDEFSLVDDVESPVLYYLTFDGNTTDKRIMFFGEKGMITINDNIKNFGLNPEITGSENQEVLEQFIEVGKKFQQQNLEFIQKDFEAQKANDKELLEKLEEDYQRLLKRRVLYATNFAMSNSDLEVAPYIGLTELFDASVKILDTLNSSLSPRVKESTYGKRFQEYIDKIKANEN